MNFMKLKHNLDISNYVVNETYISYGLTDDTTFKGVKYSKTDTSFKSKIFSLIPKECQQYFSMSVMEINWTIPPHTDSDITATINCYVKTGNCTTHFYKLKKCFVSVYSRRYSFQQYNHLQPTKLEHLLSNHQDFRH